jgi:hypothetical protein
MKMTNKQANKQANKQFNEQFNQQKVVLGYNSDKTQILEIRKELQTHLASIVAECYNVEESFKKNLTIKGVRFKLFLNDSVDEIIKLQQKLNKIM